MKHQDPSSDGYNFIMLTGLLFGLAAAIILLLTFTAAALNGGRVMVTVNSYGEMYYEIPFVILYVGATIVALCVFCFYKRPLVPCFYCGEYIGTDNVFYNTDQDAHIFICKNCITKLR